MKNKHLTSLDVNQIIKHQYEEDIDAQRVVIVGQDMSALTESIKDAVKDGLKNINFDLVIPKQEQPLVIETEVIVKEMQIVEVEKYITIPQIVEVEKSIVIFEPKIIETEVIVKEPQIIEVEKIITVYETKIVEIEKPIFIKEPQIIEIEKTVTIFEPKIIEIERPIFIDRIKADIPSWVKLLICSETIILLGVLLSYLNKSH